MSHHTLRGSTVHDETHPTGAVDPITPEEAMDKVHAWTDPRVVGERATTRLEILAAFGVHLSMPARPRQITVELAWRDPACVELTISWSTSGNGPDRPDPPIVDALTVLTKEWFLVHTDDTAELVCVVEDTDDPGPGDQTNGTSHRASSRPVIPSVAWPTNTR